MVTAAPAPLMATARKRFKSWKKTSTRYRLSYSLRAIGNLLGRSGSCNGSLADDVRELDADRGSSSAVVEGFTADRCARADDGGDYAGVVSELPPSGCDWVPVVRDFAPVVRFNADDGRELADDGWEFADYVTELPPDVKLFADDGGRRLPRRWEHAADGWELP